MKDWNEVLADLERKKTIAQSMGAAEKRQKRSEQGLLNARQLIDLLADEASFCEMGTFAGIASESPADALVGGFAKINGRDVVISCEDYTVHAGTIGEGSNAKRIKLADAALRERLPFIMIFDGVGMRATSSGLDRYPCASNDLPYIASLRGKVPTVALIAGTCVGHGALAAAMMDFVIMLDDSVAFSSGPAMAKMITGEEPTKNDLGGAQMHSQKSGFCHYRCSAEGAAQAVSSFLSFLPSSAWQYPMAATQSNDLDERAIEKILSIVPCDPYEAFEMTQLIEAFVDEGSMFEVQAEYGQSMVVALARLGGDSVLVVANQSNQRFGVIDRAGAVKATRYINMANEFHLPVIFLADNFGVMPGAESEASGILNAAAELLMAQTKLRSPKLHVSVRNFSGIAISLMAMGAYEGQSLTVAFPQANIAGLPSNDDDLALVWKMADSMAYDEVIDPRQVRNVLLRGLKLSLNRRAVSAEPAA